MQVQLQHTPGSKGETRCLDNWGKTHEAQSTPFPRAIPLPFILLSHSFPFPYLTPSTQ